MADYAEVEIAANELHTTLVGCKVISVQTAKKATKEEKKLDQIVGWQVSSVSRVGKSLLFAFEKPKFGNKYLGCRLGMSGRWRVFSKDYKVSNLNGWAATIILEYHGECIALVYTDPRKFGSMEIRRYAHEIESLRIYGPDIRSSQFTKEWVAFFCSRHKVPIKAVLMEQRYLPGGSNWITSEILFNANLDPFMIANKLSKEQIRRLFEAIHLTINNSITRYGKQEEDYMNVYGLAGKACRICHDIIKKDHINKRSVYWCPTCQSSNWKKPKPVDEAFVKDVVKAVLQ